jgi:hypothetical protein
VASATLEPAEFSPAGDLEPFGCCFVRLHLGHDMDLPLGTNGPWLSSSPISSSPALPFQLAPAFATFRLSQSNATLFTVRHEEAILLYVTHHAFLLHLLAEAFEQSLLRLTLS